MAKKKASNGIFKLASQLRKKHPNKHRTWQQYVQEASREVKKGAKPKAKVSGTKKKSRPAKIAAVPKAIGSVAFHKSQARKQLEEQLAWLLLARDQEKRKRERTKLSKKVAQKRQELQKLK